MADSSDLDFGATVRSLAPGSRIFSRFTLTRALGRGGMGVVWLARDGQLDLDVALKLLPEAVGDDEAAVADLARETRRARELSHPHIVRVFDFHQGERLAGISMEFVDGATLTGRRIRQPGQIFEPGQLVPWVRQLCAALEYAHEDARIVHRDLKPANLMIGARERLKIADFGISASVSESVTRVSRVASSSGSPPYMSPQQMFGERASPSDDIYALGATLYELLTGKPPFFSGNIFAQVRGKVPPPVAGRREELEVNGAPIPVAWEETLAACLAKDPADRPASAREVASRLAGNAGTARAAPRDSLGEAPTVVSVRPGAVAPPASEGGMRPTGETAVLATMPEKQAAGPTPGQPWTAPQLGLEMVWIRPGRFAMGSADGDSDEKPVTRVTLSSGYWLGKYEVTQGEWEALMGSNPSRFKRVGARGPVERVSWEDAMDFCRKLTEQERAAGRLPANLAYTLPTEAQWEYACRAGTTGAYAGPLDAMAWHGGNSGRKTHAVGQKQANAWGLYDMHGNVWEWCADWYGTYPGGSVTDPKGAASGTYRVLRGGGWVFTASLCRAANRDGNEPGLRNLDLGFRLALSSVP